MVAEKDMRITEVGENEEERADGTDVMTTPTITTTAEETTEKEAGTTETEVVPEEMTVETIAIVMIEEGTEVEEEMITETIGITAPLNLNLAGVQEEVAEVEDGERILFL